MVIDQLVADEDQSESSPTATASIARPSRWWQLIRLAVLAAVAASVAGFFARQWWPLELASHFRVQYCWFLLASAVVMGCGRCCKFAALAAAFGLINLSFFAGDFFGADAASTATTDAPTLRVLGLNVLLSNHDFDEVVELIERTKPDVVVLCEFNRRWLDEMRAIHEQFPYRHLTPRDDAFGIALYSRLPIDEADATSLADSAAQAVVSRIRVGDQSLNVVGAHVFPPISGWRAHKRNEQLTHLAKIAADQNGPTIVIGDLNVTPWSPYFGDFVEASGLRDSRRGFGLQTSWSCLSLRLPIDHCLVSPEIVVHRRSIESVAGSDHDAVLVDISIESASARHGEPHAFQK